MINILFSLLSLLNYQSLHNESDSGSGIESGSGNEPNMYDMYDILNSVEYYENDLRQDIFENYNKLNIPVLNNSDTINLLYGISIESLVLFDQKAETIKLNTLTTLIWEDQYLKWDDDLSHTQHSHDPDFIVVPNNLIWQPDLELYNAGSKPEIFETYGQSKLYKNGVIVYNRPTSYTFSCKLSLEDFPFDVQICNMTFGSWKYPKAILNLRPFRYSELENSFYDKAMEMMFINPHHNQIFTPVFLRDLRNVKNISVSSSFSHNEWNIENVEVNHQDIEYLCCPGDLWPNTEFSITLKRNSNKYVVIMVMAVFITLSSLVVNILHLTTYRRTYILVFIPLTLIWLQIHSSSKIPIIEYPTKLEKIIQLCFYTTIISAFESGIIYNLVLNRFNKLGSKFKESTFERMETRGFFKSILIYKTKESENTNDNKFFQGYVHSMIVFDNIFRIMITFIFLIILAVFI
jgi:hypothetical protein